VLTSSRVSKDLIHRAHDQEILVSPPWRAAAGGYGTTTVTGGIGPYYRDHPVTHRADLLLLIEACRQAALSVAHLFEGLAPDIAFFFNSIAVDVSDLGALLDDGPELTITTAFQQMRLRGNGSPRQIRYTQLAAAGPGRPAVQTAMSVQGVPRDRYPELRRYDRAGSVPPTTADLRATARERSGTCVPAAVGRTRATNVVLADLQVGAERSSARLAPDFANASLFDHDYDHYPALVLLEAGRQLALASTGDPSRSVVTAVRAEFPRFAELDIPAVVTARRDGSRTEVMCRQHDVVVTRMSFGLTVIGGAP
jgi:hypothetical protein